MSTNFRIFSNKNFAHRKNKPDKYVCYRTVLAHALLQKMKSTSKRMAKDTFLAFKKAVEKNAEFKDDKFVCHYPVKIGHSVGHLIIDKSGGYYPLIFYPHSKCGKTRKNALEMVLKDMANNIDSLLDTLEKQREWNSKLQASLQDKIFHYIEDNVKKVI